MGIIKSKLLIIIGLICFYGCKTTIEIPIDVTGFKKWNESCIEKYTESYILYSKVYKDKCWEKNRDMSFDFERKIKYYIDIVHFDKHMELLMKALNRHSIKYDSIIAVNFYTPEANEEGSLYLQTDFIVFKSGIPIKQFYTFETEVSFEIKKCETCIEFFEKIQKKENGCDYGLVIVTNITNQNQFKISKVIINPDNMFEL